MAMCVSFMSILSISSTAQQIKLWMSGMRTRYGKLSRRKHKSGKGVDDDEMDDSLTERDNWIYEHLKFLDNHIVRVPSRQSGKVIN